jgi:gas vesicle protein
MSTLEKGSVTISGFLVGAAVGAVVGAGVALLLAPQSGKETRKWIGTKSREAKDRIGEALEHTTDVIRHEASAIAANLEARKH